MFINLTFMNKSVKMPIRTNTRKIPDEYKFLVEILKNQNCQKFRYYSKNQGLICIRPFAENWEILTNVCSYGYYDRYSYLTLKGAIDNLLQWEQYFFQDRPLGCFQSITNAVVSETINGKTYHHIDESKY